MFETNQSEEPPQHIINWNRVHQQTAPITPKGKRDAYIHLGVMPGYFLVITDDQGPPIFPIVFYPKKIIAVYGF